MWKTFLSSMYLFTLRKQLFFTPNDILSVNYSLTAEISLVQRFPTFDAPLARYKDVRASPIFLDDLFFQSNCLNVSVSFFLPNICIYLSLDTLYSQYHTLNFIGKFSLFLKSPMTSPMRRVYARDVSFHVSLV